MIFLSSVVCRTRESIVWVSTTTRSPSISLSGLSGSCPCIGVSSGNIWHNKKSDGAWKNWINRELEKIHRQAARRELTFSAIVEALVISTKIGSFWGSADGGSVGVESNAWDSSFVDWDAILDNYKGMGSERWTSVREEDELFTWAADGLVLRSLFPVVVFWVVPWTALRFEDWYITIVEAAWVFINFFSEGAIDPILETRHDGW